MAAKKKSTRKRAKSAKSTKKKTAAKTRRRIEAKAKAEMSAAGAATIIYIHGIGNKPPASVLKRQWDQALFEFDLGERSRLAYWVDRERYPVPLEDVDLGGDYADGSEEAPQGEFSPRTVRASWNPDGELARIDDDLAELLAVSNNDATEGAPRVQATRLRSLAARLLGETPLTNDAHVQRSRRRASR